MSSMRAILAVAGMILALPAVAQGVDPRAVAGLEGQHPGEYFRRAKELFEAGRRDDAVFALYFGQLRYRRFLAARPELPKDRDPALFSALMSTVAAPINAYALGNIRAMTRCIDAILVHDRRSPDSATPETKFAEAHRVSREGLERVKADILKDRALIRAERAKNGLPNRG